MMAYKTGDRNQISMLPPIIDEYVGENDPVRAYDAFIDALNLDELGLKDKRHQVGNSSYDPGTMLKILVYAYSYGWRSSRKIERALHHNLSFIWLAGGLKPDFKTISTFRKENRQVLKAVLRQSVRMCIELELIEGNCLFVDGSKFRANASINQTKSKAKWTKRLASIDETIESLLKKSEAADLQETGSLVELNQELQGKQKLRNKVADLLQRMDLEKRQKINGTDPDCVNVKGRQGCHAGYNVQGVADEKNGLLVNVDVVSENNDLNQFSNQIDQANQALDKPCEIACGDAGYANATDLKNTLEKGIDVVVPSAKQATRERKPEHPFDKDKFQYDAERDCYICPEGHILTYRGVSKQRGYNIYRSVPSVCKACLHYGSCTKNKRGREINRLMDEEVKEFLEKRYNTPDAKVIYQKRKEKVELPFGHIKRTLQGGSFLVRGLESAKGE